MTYDILLVYEKGSNGKPFLFAVDVFKHGEVTQAVLDELASMGFECELYKGRELNNAAAFIEGCEQA